MEFIMEFVLSFWMEIAIKIMPQKSSKKAGLLAKILIVFLILYVIIAFTAGGIMLMDGVGSRGAAIVLIVSSVMIFLSQIILGIVFYSKNK